MTVVGRYRSTLEAIAENSSDQSAADEAQKALEARKEEPCSQCGGLGWVFDYRPDKPSPLMLEFMPCLIPDCEVSGRPIQNICFQGVESGHASMHPSKGHVMSVSGGAE